MADTVAETRFRRSIADEYFRLAYPGYRLGMFETNSGTETAHLYFQPVKDAVCPECGKHCSKKHSTVNRIIRCAPRDGFCRVFLHVPVRRVRCDCGCRRMEAISWLDSHARISHKLTALIQADLRDGDTNSTVAKRYGVDWSTVKRLDKAQLEHCFSEIDMRGVKHLIMDEFSIQKGHRYATIVMDADTHRALWVCKGKSGNDVKVFFEELKAKGLADRILSVSMDMNACFPGLVKQYLPNARILYDLFHVLQMFTRDVLVAAKKHCQERVNQQLSLLDQAAKQATAGNDPLTSEVRHRLRAELKNQRAILTSSQWVLVKPQDNLEADEFEKLRTLRENNQLLADLYPIADLLRNIWKTKGAGEVSRLVFEVQQLLLTIARTHDFAPARAFANMLKRRIDGILYAGLFGYGSCPLEGANNAIKVVKRVAFGFRDFEYFKLKIYARLPGKRRNPYKFLTRSLAVTKQGLYRCCFHTNS